MNKLVMTIGRCVGTAIGVGVTYFCLFSTDSDFLSASKRLCSLWPAAQKSLNENCGENKSEGDGAVY